MKNTKTTKQQEQIMLPKHVSQVTGQICDIFLLLFSTKAIELHPAKLTKM